MFKKICLLATALVLCASLVANACDCAAKKRKCDCGADCKCGCQEGGECNCEKCTK